MHTARGKTILLAIVLAIILLAVNSIYYTYNYEHASYIGNAYAASINVASTPQLPIARPSEYRLLSDVTNPPGDRIYVRLIVLTDTNNQFDGAVVYLYAEDPDIFLFGYYYALLQLNLTLFDDQNNILFTDTLVDVFSFVPLSGPGNGAYNITYITINPPVQINATKSIESGVLCFIGC